MLTVNINGQEIKLEKTMTILEAARGLGIKIPTFCHYPGLELFGGCRMCLVEVEKMPRLQTSCTVYMTDGMIVRTESEGIKKARKAMLEFILINHPLDCPWCDKAGECELQDLTLQYGAEAGRFKEGKRLHPESIEDPLIVRNTERCILCTRCVRVCADVQGAAALTIKGRGGHSVIEPFSGGKFDCDYCGNCVTVCPVGALMSRLHRNAYRPWQMETEVKSVCAFCGVGCSMMIQARSNKITRTLPKLGLGINNGILCAKGRFGYGYLESGERLTTPLIRKGTKLEPATWDEALTLVAGKLKSIRSKYGSKVIGGIASARCTVEENYVFQKFFRAGLGSNNIDSIAGTGYSAAQEYIESVLGKGATANSISGIQESGAIIVIGGDPTNINPVLGVQVRVAHSKGAKVLTIGYTPGLQRHRTQDLSPYPFTEGTLLIAILSEILKTKTLTGADSAFEEKISVFIQSQKPELEGVCEVSSDAVLKFTKDIIASPVVSLIVGADIIQRTDGRTNLFLLTAIAYILGAKISLLSEKPNEQGAMDAGCLPDKLPGGKPLETDNFREQCGETWGCVIALTPGLTLMEMVEAANSGAIKALYIMGENPVYNLPDSNYVKSSLGTLEFMVVQDIFMTETAQMADVVLPSLGWAEKDGTYVNLERRMQRITKAVNREGMEDWRILTELGKKMGLKAQYAASEDIMAELAEISPLHEGVTYVALGDGIPYNSAAHVGKLKSGDWPLPAPWVPSGKNDIYLMLDKDKFHSGTISRQSKALNSIYEKPYARISPGLAKKQDLTEGDTVIIRSDKGQLTLPVKIDKVAPEHVVLLTNYFNGLGALSLVKFQMDPVTKVPCINGVKITIEKVAVQKDKKGLEVQ